MPELSNEQLAAKYAPKEETPAAEVVVETDEEEIPETLAEAEKVEVPKAEEKKKVGRPAKKKEEEKVKHELDEAEVVEELSAETQSLIDEYSEEDTDTATPAEEKEGINPQIIEEYEQLKEVVSDPFVSSYLEWKKAGGSNPKDFIKELGITGVEKTISDYVRAEAISLGLEGEDLESSIADELERFGELSTIQQKKKLKEYRDSDTNSLDEKIKSFSGVQSEKAKQLQAAQVSASEKLTQEVEKLKGQKYKGLLIDEPMAKQILKDAPMFSTAVFDEKGALTHYDVEKGIRASIYLNYEKKILKETFNLGRTAAAKEFAQKRNRPNPDTVATPVSNAPTSDEEFATAKKAISKEHGGLGN